MPNAALLQTKTSTADNHINVLFCSDRNFIPYFATTLYSLLSNYKDQRELHIYLLTDSDLTDDDADKIKSMASTHPFVLHPLIVDASAFGHIKTTVGISVATYNRLLMASVLPANVDRILYFDSDLIITKDIGDIYDLPMDDLLFRGCEDSISKHYKLQFDLPAQSHHINAGVMLCNVALMRKINFEGEIATFLDAHQYRIVMGDQQIINEVFHERIGTLPLEWNVHGSMFTRGWVKKKVGEVNGMDKSEAMAAIKSPAVIHYTFKRKPWHSNTHPHAKLWQSYNKRTPFRVRSYQQSLRQSLGLNWMAGHVINLATGLSQAFSRLGFIQKVGKDLIGLLADPDTLRPRDLLDTNERAQQAALREALAELGARRRNQSFTARDFVHGLRPGASILCNALQRDIDGGFNENLKTILKTSNISRKNISSCDVSMILVHRVKRPEFWDCINTACFYEIPLIFVETSLFSAFSAYFDRSSKPIERRSLGFIFDDMGYYFDARQPSRVEATLNDPSFSLSDAERARAASLISTIEALRITKYNKYVPLEAPRSDLGQGYIVVIDQKRGDASIEFAKADDTSFDRMLLAAIEENPGKQVYLKIHPDNLHRGFASEQVMKHERLRILTDEISAPDLLDAADKVYVVSSQVGFEALLRGKPVVTFGIPFYAGWGLTDDRCPIARRTARRSIEDIFHVICLRQSLYINPKTGELVQMEEMLELVTDMRKRFQAN
ncbi:hypothetical protein M8R20_00925 [Pseudomonas sp. R2.Fl]|nr:hypothetical protein [Pseudomonas sp. R2.Fl]